MEAGTDAEGFDMISLEDAAAFEGIKRPAQKENDVKVSKGMREVTNQLDSTVRKLLNMLSDYVESAYVRRTMYGQNRCVLT